MPTEGKKIKDYIPPMLATAVDKPFSSSEWLFELKLDGYRAIAEMTHGKLFFYSRNGLSLIKKYPTIVTALRKIKTDIVLDGEVVLLNEKGRPDFQKLQNYGQNKNYQLVYYVFDILSHDGNDLKALPLIERKKLLKKVLKKSGPVRFCSHVEEHGDDFFKAVKGEDMEGIIAKKKDSRYTPGMRTREWLKIKYHKSQEAIIVGYTEPRGSRQHFGSLLLAEYDRDKLKYIGHAGTGFSESILSELYQKMKPLVTMRSPLPTLVKTNNKVTWVRPKLVCEVSYSEITRDGQLRHPVFKGLRPDKVSTMVKEESEKTIPVTRLVKTKRSRT
jgi:bifunctional non-homologous end joining protein LigD